MKNIDILTKNLIAHRGVCDNTSIENTLPAFIKSMENGYPIELDIHILIDKTIVVYHDYNLKRLTNECKFIENLSYAQLSNYKINKKYTIPTLKQVMHIINGKVPIIIDIKDIDNSDVFKYELIKILDNYKGNFAIHSTNPYFIDWIIKNKNNYIVGLIILNKVSIKLFKKCIKKCDFISVNKKILPIKSNKIILSWTIKNISQLDKYKKYCDNFICEKFLINNN